jgi:hypothetical protein
MVAQQHSLRLEHEAHGGRSLSQGESVMEHREYVRELDNTEQDIKQALGHIDHERAAIEEIRENGGNPQTAEALLHALELAVNVMEQHREIIREELAVGRLLPNG